ncbi:hypothetical protein D3C72_2191970 [compost metagenome]
MVALLSGADEIVVRRIQHLAHGAEFVGIALGEILDRDAFGPRRLLHLLAMLVRSGEEEDVLSVEPLEPRHGVGGDQLVGMADMRLAVRIGDGCGDEVGVVHGRSL